LLHCLSLENEDCVKAYKIIRNELKDYNEELSDKKEVIILTKTDLVDEKKLASVKKKLEKLNKNILTATVYDNESIKSLKDNLIKILREQL
jgi:GTP-binding protein